MSHEYDEDTAVSPVEPGRYRGNVTERWSIGPVPNGGYVMAIGANALGAALERPDPLSLTAHFLRPAQPGPVEVEVDVAKRGRTMVTGGARVMQGGSEVVRLVGAYGDLSTALGPTRIDGAPPVLPPRAACVGHPESGMSPTIAQRFEQYFDPSTVQWMRGEGATEMEIRAWIRFAGGREADTGSLVLFADALPPPVFNAVKPGWVPTISITVYVRARPVPGWLRAVFRTRFLSGGFLEEDGELWDESGQLVALSRQLAAAPR